MTNFLGSGNDIKNSGDVIPLTDNTYDLGTSLKRYRTLNVDKVDNTSAALNLGTTNATRVDIAAATVSTLIKGKAYLLSTRPIMSGGFSMVTDTSIANTTVETSIVGAGVGSLTANANTISVGNSSKMEASGSVTVAGGAQTLTLRTYGGPTSTLLLSTYVLVLQTLTGSPPPWNLQTALTVKSIGVTGTVQMNSVFSVNDQSPTQMYVNKNLATIDTTVNNVINVTAQWTTANASNVFITNQFFTHSVFVV